MKPTKMKQQNFTFKRKMAKAYPLGYLPIAHITTADEFKAQMVKKGYLVKNIQKFDYYACDAARANVSHEERKKLQREIDSTPPQTTFKIK